MQINEYQLNNLANTLAIGADKGCDYIPFVSTATTIINIFQKCVILPLMNLRHIKKGKYFEYLDNKSMTRCLWLLVPIIGNLISKVLGTMDAHGPARGLDNHHAIGNSFTIAFLHTIGILSEGDFRRGRPPHVEFFDQR
ncbi:MAG: hypothetical protein NTX49_06945 [Chlamydiae bacterium]|nr:hypothetical protein [Chlamydiota bacterium]